MFKRVLVLGASRGLGAAVVSAVPSQFENVESLILVSRKEHLLEKLKLKMASKINAVSVVSCDFSRLDDTEKIHKFVEDSDLVIYCAGGGPYGEFTSKDFKDHQWSLNVNLVSPMALLHQWLKKGRDGTFVVVGSAIAERDPDSQAASYAAGKHGLYGLVSSLQEELRPSRKKVMLFSPGYMDSELLPLKAKVRHDGSQIATVDVVAENLLRSVRENKLWHISLN